MHLVNAAPPMRAAPRERRKVAALPIPYPKVTLGSLGVLATWFYGIPKGYSVYYSRSSGMRVSVRRVGFCGLRPALHGVRVATPEGEELVRFGSVLNGGKAGVDGTARNAHFTVVFRADDLLANSWDVVRAAMWAPRIAFTGNVALTLRLCGEPQPLIDAYSIDATGFDAARGGAVGAVGFVRRLTQDALRADLAHVPRQMRKAAHRLIREKWVEDVEKVRRGAVGVVDEMRKAASEVDQALEGLPDLQNVRSYTRTIDKVLEHTRSSLGGGSAVVQDEDKKPHRGAPMLDDGYRELDEGSAY